MSINRFSEKIVMPVCLITVKSDSFINSMTVAWSTPLSANPPLFGFAIKKQRYTYPMLMKEKEKEFTVTLENLKPLMYLTKDTFSTIDEGKIKKIDTKKVIEEIRKKLKRGVQGD
jgi:flavin reductase (DIM6/NTAB) family NADH-FMN oxidoreductase RutF